MPKPAAPRQSAAEKLDSLAHDVRTPLAALLMWTRLLKSGEARRPAALDAIERSAVALSTKLDELEPLARGLRKPKARKHAALRVSPRVAEAVRALVAALGERVPEGCEIVIRLEPGEPQVYVGKRTAGGGDGDTPVTAVSLSPSSGAPPPPKRRRRGNDAK